MGIQRKGKLAALRSESGNVRRRFLVTVVAALTLAVPPSAHALDEAAIKAKIEDCQLSAIKASTKSLAAAYAVIDGCAVELRREGQDDPEVDKALDVWVRGTKEVLMYGKSCDEGDDDACHKFDDLLKRARELRRQLHE